jgi:hypothetical protein
VVEVNMVETLLIIMLSGFNSSKVTLRHFGRERKMNDCITPATQFIKMCVVYTKRERMMEEKYFLKNAVKFLKYLTNDY